MQHKFAVIWTKLLSTLAFVLFQFNVAMESRHVDE